MLKLFLRAMLWGVRCLVAEFSLSAELAPHDSFATVARLVAGQEAVSPLTDTLAWLVLGAVRYASDLSEHTRRCTALRC